MKKSISKRKKPKEKCYTLRTWEIQKTINGPRAAGAEPQRTKQAWPRGAAGSEHANNAFCSKKSKEKDKILLTTEIMCKIQRINNSARAQRAVGNLKQARSRGAAASEHGAPRLTLNERIYPQRTTVLTRSQSSKAWADLELLICATFHRLTW